MGPSKSPSTIEMGKVNPCLLRNNFAFEKNIILQNRKLIVWDWFHKLIICLILLKLVVETNIFEDERLRIDAFVGVYR